MLFTPRPLGPLARYRRGRGRRPGGRHRTGAVPYEVAAAVRRVLEQRPPTILVLEDVHAADEATLDVMRLARSALGRPAGAGDRNLPGRWAGSLASAADRARRDRSRFRPVDRLRLAPLSRDAVAQLAAPHGAEAERALRSRRPETPSSSPRRWRRRARRSPPPSATRCSVAPRRLSPGARMLLDAIAVAGSQAELWLLDALAERLRAMSGGMHRLGHRCRAGRGRWRSPMSWRDSRSRSRSPCTAGSRFTALRWRRWSRRPTALPTPRVSPTMPTRPAMQPRC